MPDPQDILDSIFNQKSNIPAVAQPQLNQPSDSALDAIFSNAPPVQEQPQSPGILQKLRDLYTKYSTPWDWAEKGTKGLAKFAQENPTFANAASGIPIVGPVLATEANKYAAPIANELEKATVGNPIGLTGSALSLGAGTSLPIAGAANRALAGLGAVAAVPNITEGFSKGNYGQMAGGVLQAALGTIGAKSPSEMPVATPAEEATNQTPFILKNWTPRNVDELTARGNQIGDVLPVNPQTGMSPGRLVNSTDTVLPAGETPQSLPTVTMKPSAQSPQQAIMQWIGDRRAAQIESNAVGQQFDNLRDLPLTDAATNPQVRQYFDNKYAQLSGSGKNFGYKENYLPQLWADSPEDVAKVFGPQRLTSKASFEFNSVLKDYQQGIDQGLTPKFDNVADLASWYEQTANKAMADRNFFETLKNMTLSGRPVLSTKPNDFNDTLLSPDTFPVRYVKDAKGNQTALNYYAPEQLADQINNYLGGPKLDWLNNAANVISTTKGFRLAAGIPNTGFNVHGFNIAMRNALASDNPVSAYATGLGYLANPSQANQYVNDNLGKVGFWARAGVDMGMENTSFSRQPSMEVSDINSITDVGKYALGKQQQWFEHPLFQQVMPAMKVQLAEQLLPQYAKQMNGDANAAAPEVAKFVNSIFGGKQLDALTRNKDTQNFFRTIFLAPTWLESNAQIGKGLGQAMLNPNTPQGQAYRTVARNLALAYMSANVANIGLSGHWMGGNEAGKNFAIDTGQKDSNGKIIYLNPFGTAADFARIPVDAAMSIANGDMEGLTNLGYNRLSPVAPLVTGKNYRNQQLYTKDLGTSAKRIGQVGLDMFPPFVSSPLNFATGAQSGPEALSQSVEAPLAFRKPFVPGRIGKVNPIY